MIDHPDQLKDVRIFKDTAGYDIGVFIKIDSGYHRAGVESSSSVLPELLSLLVGNPEISACTILGGFYSHAGHSYAGSSAQDAMTTLKLEIQALCEAANVFRKLCPNVSHRRFTLSAGATPTATSIECLLAQDNTAILSESYLLALDELKSSIQHASTIDDLELHAGVYPFLDIQQLATQASPSAVVSQAQTALSTADLALTILTEVASLYRNRPTSEVLIAAGSLALGREPCKSYQGWGIVSNWGMTTESTMNRSGWQVGRISQEHGILTRDPTHVADIMELSIGQKLRIFPNHACIAGAGFGWYLVVDSSLEDRKDEIVDVWVRWRGW